MRTLCDYWYQTGDPTVVYDCDENIMPFFIFLPTSYETRSIDQLNSTVLRRVYDGIKRFNV